jgi:hypothetical protein
MKKETPEAEEKLREIIKPLVENGLGSEVKKLTVKHGGTEISDIPESEHSAFISDIKILTVLLKHLIAQERLMKAAQTFAISFDQNRNWADELARLTYTLTTWRELALAAVEFSNDK